MDNKGMVVVGMKQALLHPSPITITDDQPLRGETNKGEMCKMKKEIFTPLFKRQLVKTIREHYPEYKHVPFSQNQGKDILDWEYNPKAVRLDGIIEDEAFELDGRAVKCDLGTFILPVIPTPTYMREALIEQKVIDITPDGFAVLKSRKGKTYTTRTRAGFDQHKIDKAITAIREGKMVSALVEPVNFDIIDLEPEVDLFESTEDIIEGDY